MTTPCPSCTGAVAVGERFCPHCGVELPAAEPNDPGAAGDDPGGPADPRHHWVETPAGWVAGCCDRGRVHEANEDAVAVAADDRPGGRAVLVVCDGVTSAADSAVAALAAARSARDVLVTAPRPPGPDDPVEAHAARLAAAMTAATERAASAVLATGDGREGGPSCTLAAAVLDGTLLVLGTVGDSRVYWLPDPGAGEPQQLGADDSVAQFRIDLGVERERAEHSPQAHAITRWLGPGSPDHTPRTGSVALEVPGWVLVCTDGLWNDASSAAALQQVVHTLVAGGAADAAALATALVAWANERGGHDNIAVALARVA